MKLCFVLVLLAISFQTGSFAQGFFVVAPGSNFTNGNSGSIIPFFYGGGSRYQQVYSSALFPSATAGGFLITNMAFRVDENAGTGINGTYSSIQINLSTTQREPNSLDSVFSNNIGADNTVVFGPGSLSVVASWPHQPETFQFQVLFSRPFLYNPLSGNLLLDIEVLGSGIDTTSLDAMRGLSTGSSSLFSNSGGLSGRADDLALVTRFGGVPVPEPSTYALFALGAAALWFCRRPTARRTRAR